MDTAVGRGKFLDADDEDMDEGMEAEIDELEDDDPEHDEEVDPVETTDEGQALDSATIEQGAVSMEDLGASQMASLLQVGP